MLKEVIDSHVIGDVHTIESRVHGEKRNPFSDGVAEKNPVEAY